MTAQASSSIDWPSVGVAGAVVLLVIVTGIRRVWLFTWVHDQIVEGWKARLTAKDAELALERAARQQWQNIALRNTGLLEEAVAVAHTSVKAQAPEAPA